MTDRLNSLCDDLYLDMCVNTALELPVQRDTILAFFERVQKQYPAMNSLSRRGQSEYYLESPQDSGQYRWVCLDADRLASGLVNPDDFADAYDQHRFILELAPYMLSLSHLDIDCLDVTITMDFDCPDSHDEVISEALLGGSAFWSLMEIPGARPIGVSPGAVFSISEDSCTQARIGVESRTSVYDPRKPKDQPDQAISLSFTIRQYPQTGVRFNAVRSFQEQCRLLEEIMEGKIVPYFVRPLVNTIAHRRLS
jgi:hypothetical protein